MLAHRVIFNGSERGLSLVEIEHDGVSRLWSVQVSPFSGETHSTAFVDGTIVIDCEGEVSATEPTVKII